ISTCRTRWVQRARRSLSGCLPRKSRSACRHCLKCPVASKSCISVRPCCATTLTPPTPSSARWPRCVHSREASSLSCLGPVGIALESHGAAALPGSRHVLEGVWRVTRTKQQGDLFGALSGQKFDAHVFRRNAVTSGAAAVVVSKIGAGKDLGVAVFHVRDPR